MNHHGHNIKRWRNILDMKQESIAHALGMTQQNFSLLEQKQKIDDPTVEKVAKEMNISAELIKNFDERDTIHFVLSTFHDNSNSVLSNPKINPIDKIIELYERIIYEKNEEIDLLKQLLKNKSLCLL